MALFLLAVDRVLLLRVRVVVSVDVERAKAAIDYDRYGYAESDQVRRVDERLEPSSTPARVRVHLNGQTLAIFIVHNGDFGCGIFATNAATLYQAL